MRLTASDLKIVRSALADAIDDRDSYLDCLMHNGKVMPGWEKSAKETRALIAIYKRMQLKVIAACKAPKPC
jgi:hypothetical protein